MVNHLCGDRPTTEVWSQRAEKETIEMKKLMMAVAIVCAAAGVQAASYTWTINGITATGSAPLSDGNYYAFVFLTSDSSKLNATMSVEDAISAIKSYSDPWTTFSWYSDVQGTGKSTIDAADPKIDVTGVGTDNQYTMHAMAIITDSWNNDKMVPDAPVWTAYQVVDLGDITFIKDTNLSGSFSAGNNWQPVSDVPEPTSGLLLLLGVAGLALKRKRA